MPRPLTRAVVLLAVLGVLAVVADRAAAFVVARTVSQGLTASQGLGRPAAVSFPDVPFLTQALGGRYDTVDVTLQDLPTRSGLVVDRIDASLHGVSAPPGALLRRELRQLPVDEGDAVAFVSFASLAAAVRQAVGADVTALSLSRAGPDRVAISTRVRTAFGTFPLRGQSRLSITDGKIVARLLPNTVTGIPAVVRDQIARMFGLTLQVPPLPFGFRMTSLTVVDTGLRLAASGTQLTLTTTRSGSGGT